MGAPGWDDAPDAKPAPAPTKPITLVWPYYENPEWLEVQLSGLRALSADVRSFLSLIVSDDGSPRSPAAPIVRAAKLPLRSVRVFRIDVDVRWNWLAARNVAMKHASGWCLLTDIDHVAPEWTLLALQRRRHEAGTIYRLGRLEHDGKTLHPHPNSFFCTAEDFWDVGGYDEALSGHYGTDGDWRRRAAAAKTIRTLPDALIRHEHKGDSSTLDYKRKQPEDAGKKAILRRRGPGWRPASLTFPWHEEKL